MIAVIFEVSIAEGQTADYLQKAADLKPELAKIEGFISIERFQSLSDPDKLVSLSFWKDEVAVAQWRNREMHREAQAAGREYIFKDYRLRIAEITRDYGMFDRKEAPKDSKKKHEQ